MDDYADCCTLCAATGDCVYFTHNQYDEWGNNIATCYLKTACNSLAYCGSDCVTGQPASSDDYDAEAPTPSPVVRNDDWDDDQECVNGIAVGSLQITQDGIAHTYYALQSGANDGTAQASGTEIRLQHGPRVFLASACSSTFSPDIFQAFDLRGKTLGFTVDVSSVSCGCNAALYAVHMPAYDSSNSPTSTSSGDYYCDASAVSGVYCPEMDIMEANTGVLQSTAHSCTLSSGNYYSYCDSAGTGNSTRDVGSDNYQEGSSTGIDSSQEFQVLISFFTDEQLLSPGAGSAGTSSASSSNGNVSLVETVLTQPSTGAELVLENADSAYLSAMSLESMVLTFSHWGDSASNMAWLDNPPCSMEENCDTSGEVIWSDFHLRSAEAAAEKRRRRRRRARRPRRGGHEP
uniref:cellulase n=1 Tax=Rhizochromulina marina TaxID=1034831 RepID=A0A7S2R799_9STRA|mmetsp:Transcript_12096/g.34992  ORF Transcript_12096/g.34992 Transcript_12096/m.34992 type:complete len:404 (+) Transcript_12096:453-1664(+)